MNWHFSDDGIKPHDFQDCIAIESRERRIVDCYWSQKENLFRTLDGGHIFYLGEFDDYDNYVLAWISVDEIFKDYFAAKEAKHGNQ